MSPSCRRTVSAVNEFKIKLSSRFLWGNRECLTFSLRIQRPIMSMRGAYRRSRYLHSWKQISTPIQGDKDNHYVSLQAHLIAAEWSLSFLNFPPNFSNSANRDKALSLPTDGCYSLPKSFLFRHWGKLITWYELSRLLSEDKEWTLTKHFHDICSEIMRL